MKLLLLGATGRVGQHILQFALQDGHDVTVLARSPEKVTIQHPSLTVLQGNVLHQEAVQRAMAGVELVISALNTDGTTTLSDSIVYILQAMQQQNVQRIITVGTAGILQSRVDPSVLRYQSSESKRTNTKPAQDHHRTYELLAQSSVEWTIVCPTYLPDGELTTVYRVERDYLPVDGAKITVADTAHFTYSLMSRNDYVRTRVGIAY